MSEWSSAEGTISSKKVSIKKIVKSVFDGEDYIADYDKNKFSIRFEQGGQKAARSIERVIAAAKDYDPACRIDIDAYIRYYE